MLSRAAGHLAHRPLLREGGPGLGTFDKVQN